jgi:lipid-A-disaccharide synthase-like uncharacterized protein
MQIDEQYEPIPIKEKIGMFLFHCVLFFAMMGVSYGIIHLPLFHTDNITIPFAFLWMIGWWIIPDPHVKKTLLWAGYHFTSFFGMMTLSYWIAWSDNVFVITSVFILIWSAVQSILIYIGRRWTSITRYIGEQIKKKRVK